MKFDMGQTTLQTLARSTQGSSGELGALIKQLVDAVTPLEGKFNGIGRQQFSSFKNRADEITVALNSSLGAILGGQQGMEAAFSQGDGELGDNARIAMSTANFDGARFSARSV